MFQFHKVKFHELDGDWNNVASSFPWFKIYHSLEWLNFVQETQGLEKLIYAIMLKDEVVGWLPGFLIRKGPLRIFASPFEGWTTAYMGPLIRADVSEARLLHSLRRLFINEKFHFAQLAYPEMDPRTARQAGFAVETSKTYIADLAETPEGQLERFSKSTRKHVRRAIRRGLVVETTTSDEFVQIYYSQLEQVFAKRGLRPTYPRSRVDSLWKHLMPTGRLIATQVKQDGLIIATRLDFHHGTWMHSFGSASDQAHLESYPNELARFHAISVGIERGARTYDMSGGGAYKAKFGARISNIPKAVFDPYRLRGLKEIARNLLRKRLKLR